MQIGAINSVSFRSNPRTEKTREEQECNRAFDKLNELQSKVSKDGNKKGLLLSLASVAVLALALFKVSKGACNKVAASLSENPKTKKTLDSFTKKADKVFKEQGEKLSKSKNKFVKDFGLKLKDAKVPANEKIANGVSGLVAAGGTVGAANIDHNRTGIGDLFEEDVSIVTSIANGAIEIVKCLT